MNKRKHNEKSSRHSRYGGQREIRGIPGFHTLCAEARRGDPEDPRSRPHVEGVAGGRGEIEHVLDHPQAQSRGLVRSGSEGLARVDRQHDLVFSRLDRLPEGLITIFRPIFRAWKCSFHFSAQPVSEISVASLNASGPARTPPRGPGGGRGTPV